MCFYLFLSGSSKGGLGSVDWRVEALSEAVEAAIAAGHLPTTARKWRQTVILEELAEVLGLPRTAIRNRFYRSDPKLREDLRQLEATSTDQMLARLQALQYRQYTPVLWRRTAEQLRETRRMLPSVIKAGEAADKMLRAARNPPIELRRELGRVSVEIMAAALTFFDGAERMLLVANGEQMFLSAMAAVSFSANLSVEDSVLFSMFWENRATVCAAEWSNIWDDPSRPPSIDSDILELAIWELGEATSWMSKSGVVTGSALELRLRQLIGDKAKWYTKAGLFSEARATLGTVSDSASMEFDTDMLLAQALEQIAHSDFPRAAKSAQALCDFLSQYCGEDSRYFAQAEMLAHHIDLLYDRRPPLPLSAERFFAEQVLVASEFLHLPRYKARLLGLGYAIPSKVVD